MRTVTGLQMQTIDRKAVRTYKIPSIVLMENAGSGAAQEIFRALKKTGAPSIVIVCGPGNNGGDGFVAARQLRVLGFEPRVFVLGKREKLKGDAAVNYEILKALKVRIRFSRPTAAELKRADGVVDAIFGVGLTREITGVFKNVIEDINRYASKVFALDIPSGLDATTGKIHGVCIRAHTTVTFHLPKKGMFLGEGPRHTGKIVVKHMGF